MSHPVAARVLPLLAVCLLIVLALTFSPSHSSSLESLFTLSLYDELSAAEEGGWGSPPYSSAWSKQNILDGCHHVYLDMGTNM